MGCGAILALGRATVDSSAILGSAHDRQPQQHGSIRRFPSKLHAPGEKAQVQVDQIPEVRQTWAVVGSQPSGVWGLEFGVNEHQVSAACNPLPAALGGSAVGLLPTDLVRLCLERGHSARHAVDVLTDLIDRHGGGSGSATGDASFAIADPYEAYVVETVGRSWAYQEVREIRAIHPLRVIRQDWDRISQGLAARAITENLWPDDGSKLDFAQALDSKSTKDSAKLRAWGRATISLQEQNGYIDLDVVRRILLDTTGGLTVTTYFLAELSRNSRPASMWLGLVLPWGTLQMPFFVAGEIPGGMFCEPHREVEQAPHFRWPRGPEERVSLGRVISRLSRIEVDEECMQERLFQIQSQIEQDSIRFYRMATQADVDIGRLATSLMEDHWALIQGLDCRAIRDDVAAGV